MLLNVIRGFNAFVIMCVKLLQRLNGIRSDVLHISFFVLMTSDLSVV